MGGCRIGGFKFNVDIVRNFQFPSSFMPSFSFEEISMAVLILRSYPGFGTCNAHSVSKLVTDSCLGLDTCKMHNWLPELVQSRCM